MASTARESYERLADLMNARRVDLGLTWTQVATTAHIVPETLRSIRIGKNEPNELTKRSIEDALMWASGSIDAVLSGGEPTGTRTVEMTVKAGVGVSAGESAPADEPPAERPDADTLTVWTTAGPVEVPTHVYRGRESMAPWRWHMWLIDLPIPERRAAINAVLEMQRLAAKAAAEEDARSERPNSASA